MSKGSTPATQQQKVEIPDAFQAWVFGPGTYGGSPGKSQGSSGFLGLGGGKNKGTSGTYQNAGFEGLLPMALNLMKEGNLAPTTQMGQGTRNAMESTRGLVDELNGQFLPQIQRLFSNVGERDLVNSQQTKDVIDASTRPIMEQLSRFAIPQTQDSAIAAGQLGSSRQGIAEGVARSDANSQMGDIASRISFGALQEQLAGERMALQFSPQLMEMMGVPTGLLSDLGQREEAYDLESRSGASRNLQALAALLQGFIPGANTTQTQVGATTGKERLGSILSGGMSGAKFGPWGAAGGAALGAILGG